MALAACCTMRGMGNGSLARRRLGRYDTPEDLAFALVRWALEGESSSLLDPSFGGCNFLTAAYRALQETGVQAPGQLIFGVDIAQETAVHRKALISQGVPSENLLLADFFDTKPESFATVDLVVGNPPYIRAHWIENGTRAKAASAVSRQGVVLPKRASTWAYFVVHAGAFLRPKGRMLLLLPGAVLFADYARAVLDYLRQNAGGCRMFRIGERIFAEATEETVIVVADSWGDGPSDITVAEVPSLAEFYLYLRGEAKLQSRALVSKSIRDTIADMLRGDSVADWTRAAQNSAFHPLGTLATIRIGIVTGANDFFIKNTEESRFLNSECARSVPVVCKGKWLKGLRWLKSDHESIEAGGNAARLIVVDKEKMIGEQIAAWIARGERRELDLRSHCRRRDPWYALADIGVPEAFLRYMGATAPRIVLNEAGVTCTNAVHRIAWKTNHSRKAIAVGSCTSLFNLQCELLGRSYGGGVLKIEPGAAADLLLPVVSSAEEIFDKIDFHLRNQNLEAAQDLADSTVLVEGVGLSRDTVSQLKHASRDLSERRRQVKGGR